jgi:hypothetical protein
VVAGVGEVQPTTLLGDLQPEFPVMAQNGGAPSRFALPLLRVDLPCSPLAFTGPHHHLEHMAQESLSRKRSLRAREWIAKV